MQITGQTRIYALFGWPVEHSLSPTMHNAAFEACRLDAVYIPWSVAPAHFVSIFQAIRGIGNFCGGNVTIPHKEKAAENVDELSPEAALLGAVNTIVPKEGKLLGYNTDGQGFLLALEKEMHFSPRGKSVVIVGAGGAAKAVCFSLAQSEARQIAIVNRTLSRAQKLADFLQGNFPGCHSVALSLHDTYVLSVLGQSDLVVNATSLGWEPSDLSPIDCSPLRPGVRVVDLVYCGETQFLREAKRRGARCAGGREMLLYQGALAWELWTGKPAPLDVMRSVLSI